MQQSPWCYITMTKWFIVIISLLSCLHSYVNAAKPKIIIIGAGASGIGAATRLIENNITDFIILEAEQRFGGRIESVFLLDGEKGGFADIGGEFLLGQKGNIVYDLAKQDLKILDESKKAKDYYSNGKPVDPEIVDDMTKLSASLLPQYKDKEPISVENAFNQKFKETLHGKYGNDPSKSQQVQDYKGTSEKMFLLRQGAYSWRNLLLNDHFESPPDAKLYAWNGKGFIRALELLMSKFGEQNRSKLYPISYGTTVERISWGTGSNVQLLTKGGKKYQADHIIFTGSAGVLKTKHENLFSPKLPGFKRKAIRDIGYKANMKIAIQYHKKWWTDDLAEFVFTFNEEDDRVLSKEFKLGQQKDGKSWLSAVTEMATIDGLPNCLMAWLVGPQVPEIEKLDVETIKRGLFAMTKRFLGKDYNVIAPKLVVPSKWHSNPNFAGVYTHETLASGNRKTQVQDDLAQPLLNSNDIPVVFFAGEHTSPNHYATVYGAVESGYRAADELITSLR